MLIRDHLNNSFIWLLLRTLRKNVEYIRCPHRELMYKKVLTEHGIIYSHEAGTVVMVLLIIPTMTRESTRVHRAVISPIRLLGIS